MLEFNILSCKKPEPIVFNYDEIKTQLLEMAETYSKIAYTDENIKAAKSDRAFLNTLKENMNKRRIALQKEYMQPFDEFKAQVDELLGIIGKPILAIDKQIKEYEAIKQDEKRQNIEDMFKAMQFPEWLSIDQIFNTRWLNASYSMSAIEKDLLEKKETIFKECQTLAALPSYSDEAIHFYKKSLDIAQALGEVRRLTEIDEMRAKKEKEEAERKAFDQVPADQVIDAEVVPADQVIDAEVVPADQVIDAEVVPADQEEPEEEKWVGFCALLSNRKAILLKEFFKNNNIQFKPIMKGEN